MFAANSSFLNGLDKESIQSEVANIEWFTSFIMAARIYEIPLVGPYSQNRCANRVPFPIINKPTRGRKRIPLGLRHKFTKEEDQKLKQIVAELGENAWPKVAARMGNRTSRQCRERYKNYLADSAKNEPWTPEEEELLEAKFNKYGPRWSLIATFFETRSDANVKNHWTHIVTLRKREKMKQQQAQNQIANDSMNMSGNPQSSLSVEMPTNDHSDIVNEIDTITDTYQFGNAINFFENDDPPSESCMLSHPWDLNPQSDEDSFLFLQDHDF